MWQLCDERGCFLPLADQDLYDFIEPNPDEDPALLEKDGQQSSHVSCIKVPTSVWVFCKILKEENPEGLLSRSSCNVALGVFQELEKVLNMSQQCKDKDSWKEESGWVWNQLSYWAKHVQMSTCRFNMKTAGALWKQQMAQMSMTHCLWTQAYRTAQHLFFFIFITHSNFT